MKASTCSIAKAIAGKAPLVVVVGQRWAADPLVRELDQRCKGSLVREARRQKFRAEPDTSAVIQTHGAVGAPIIALVPLSADPGAPGLAGLAQNVSDIAAQQNAARVAVRLPEGSSFGDYRVVAEGVAMARYTFEDYRSEPSKSPDLRVVFAIDRAVPAIAEALLQAQARAAAVCLARDLANTPAADLGPAALADRAASLAGGDLVVRCHGPRKLEKLAMGALLAVGQGSRQTPRLIEMVYEPKSAPVGHYTLVGKGITFDSGGLSLKTSASMELMKRDMAGGATVIAAIAAIAEMQLPIRVRTYVPAAENMPDGNAIRPGDVVKACNGKTIEILNTDAEGRLVLADALSHACTEKPRALVNFATLTGAVRHALGKRYAAVMGNDQTLVDAALASAADNGEGLWQLPLVESYRADIESRIADIKNTGAGGAGTIIAGLFLREFVGDTPWAHVDFSSTVMSDGYACHPAGPSGYGVRTAIGLIERLAAASD